MVFRVLLGMSLGCALVAGCAEPAGIESTAAELRTDRAAYAMGESGVLTLTNVGTEPIGPGNIAATLLCQPAVERRVGDEWQQAGWIGGVCILPGLPPLTRGGSVSRPFEVTAAVWSVEGDYRFAVVVGSANELITVVSNTFAVTAP